MGWKNFSFKKRLKDKSSVIFIFFVLFYGIQGIISIFNSNFAPPIDLFAATGIIGLVFVLHLLAGFETIVPVFIGIGFMPHILGLYKIIPYNKNYIGTLYGWSFLNYHYDWIVHSFAILCFSIVVCSIFYPYLKKSLKSKFLMFVIFLFFVLGLGAFNEILEYIGFDVFGYGEGFLEFGSGDSSPYEGPWQNSSMDLISNLAGAIIGISSFLLIKGNEDECA